MSVNKVSPIFSCGAFFTLSGGIALIFCGIFVARPGLWAKNFQETTCQVQESLKTGDKRCDCSTGDESGICFSTYPCFVVNVTYDVVDSDNKSTEVSSILHRDETIATGLSECSFVPSCSPFTSTNVGRVQSFLDMYAQVNSTYTCFYNPENPLDVIAIRQFSDAGIIASLVVPSIFFLFGFLIMCFYFLRYPEEYCCK